MGSVTDQNNSRCTGIQEAKIRNPAIKEASRLVKIHYSLQQLQYLPAKATIVRIGVSITIESKVMPRI